MNPRLTLYVFIMLLGFFKSNVVYAQQISNAWVYGGINNVEESNTCYIDDLGNRYQVIIARESFVIDSLGTPITIGTNAIQHNNQTLVIYYQTIVVKFNANGNYLYHICIPNNTPGGNVNTSITFDNQNNAYLSTGITLIDTLGSFLIDGKKNIQNLFTGIKSQSHDPIVLIKLNEGGTFNWVKAIYKISLPRDHGPPSISTNQAKNKLKLSYFNFRGLNNYSMDTIIVLATNGLQDTIFTNALLLLLEFLPSGQLKGYTEPIKNQLVNSMAGTFSFTYNTIKHKEYNISCFVLRLTADDTLYANTPIPLKEGLNTILFCTNDNDSIIWAKCIFTDLQSGPHNTKITSDTIKNEITIALRYFANWSTIHIDPILNNNANNGTYYIKINDNGDLLNSKFSSIFIHDVTWNHRSKKFITSNGTWPISVSFLDSNYNLLSTVILNPQLQYMNLAGGAYLNTQQQINTDKKGQTYISGCFNKSVFYPCINNYVTFNNNNRDVFVLKIAPLITHDTSACNPITSPSGKYLWDTTGVYYDTIPSTTNCDSVLEVRFTNLSSKVANIDTTVHANMQSPSGKFTWVSTGIYNDTLSNKYGCDSIIIFKLKVLQTKNTIDTSVCNNFITPSAKYLFDSTGIYTDTIPNSVGADSIITINLKVLKNFSKIDTSFCTSILSPSGKYTFTISGNYNDTLININGCDSIIYINYTNTTTFDTLNINSCDSTISPSGKYTYTSSGTYIDTLTNQYGCDSILTINFKIAYAQLTLTKSNNITCDSPFATLTATGGDKYKWTLNNNIIDTSNASIVVAPNENTIYKVISTNNLGCMATDSIIVSVEIKDSTITIPNVFTPNNDGINDCYSIDGIALYNKLNFTIYNRWGQEIYTTSNPTFCWDGTVISGEQAPNGTYFYIIEGVNNCNKSLKTKGTITLIR